MLKCLAFLITIPISQYSHLLEPLQFNPSPHLFLMKEKLKMKGKKKKKKILQVYIISGTSPKSQLQKLGFLYAWTLELEIKTQVGCGI
jgi:hypothetical protein